MLGYVREKDDLRFEVVKLGPSCGCAAPASLNFLALILVRFSALISHTISTGRQ